MVKKGVILPEYLKHYNFTGIIQNGNNSTGITRTNDDSRVIIENLDRTIRRFLKTCVIFP